MLHLLGEATGLVRGCAARCSKTHPGSHTRADRTSRDVGAARPYFFEMNFMLLRNELCTQGLFESKLITI